MIHFGDKPISIYADYIDGDDIAARISDLTEERDGFEAGEEDYREPTVQEQAELLELESLVMQIPGNLDYSHLISADHFVRYHKDNILDNLRMSASSDLEPFIDWQGYAESLRHLYTRVVYGGKEFWVG